MKDKDYIKDLFSEKLSNYEVPVRSDLWSGIQSQIGNIGATTAVAKGISSSLKWMIGVASSVAVIGTAVWISSADDDTRPNKKVQISESSKTSIDKVNAKESIVNAAQISIKTPPSLSVVDPTVPVSNELWNSFLPSEIPNGTKETIVHDVDSKMDAIPPVLVEEKVVKNQDLAVIVIAEVEKHFEPGKIEEFSNVFTPNGDGVNDYFLLKSENLKDFYIRIFNDKDVLVFQSNDKDFKWMGTDNSGEMVEKGNYGYVIFATDLNGKSVKVFKSLVVM